MRIFIAMKCSFSKFLFLTLVNDNNNVEPYIFMNNLCDKLIVTDMTFRPPFKEDKEIAKETRRKIKEERIRKKERKLRRKAKLESECLSEKMNCFNHDNEHWKTPPLWTGNNCF